LFDKVSSGPDVDLEKEDPPWRKSRSQSRQRIS
jgi:hypothetical protein